MKTEMTPQGELYEKGAVLLKAAREYWYEFHKQGGSGAVVWLQGDDGCLVTFTRGEYREDIKRLIDSFG